MLHEVTTGSGQAEHELLRYPSIGSVWSEQERRLLAGELDAIGEIVIAASGWRARQRLPQVDLSSDASRAAYRAKKLRAAESTASVPDPEEMRDLLRRYGRLTEEVAVLLDRAVQMEADWHERFKASQAEAEEARETAVAAYLARGPEEPLAEPDLESDLPDWPLVRPPDEPAEVVWVRFSGGKAHCIEKERYGNPGTHSATVRARLVWRADDGVLLGATTFLSLCGAGSCQLSGPHPQQPRALRDPSESVKCRSCLRILKVRRAKYEQDMHEWRLWAGVEETTPTSCDPCD